MADIILTADFSDIQTMNRELLNVSKSARTSASVFEREFNRVERVLNKNAQTSQKLYGSILKLDEPFKDAAKSASVFERELAKLERTAVQSAKNQAAADARLAREKENLAQKYLPLYAASKQYETALEEINRAQELGVISDQQRAASLEQLNADFAAGTGVFSRYSAETARRTNQLGVVMQQTGYQVGDFLVQIQSGTNPLVAFGQQATQLVGILPLMGAGFLGLSAGALVALSAGLGIAIPLVTAIGAAFMRTKEKTKGFADEAAESIDSLKTRLEELRSLQDITQQRYTQQVAALVKEINDYALKMQELSDYTKKVGMNASDAKPLLDPLREGIASAEEALVSLRKEQEDYNRVLAEVRREEAIRRLKDDLGEAAVNALQLAGVDITSGISDAAKEAAKLAAAMGMALNDALNIMNLRQSLEYSGRGGDPSKVGSDNYTKELGYKTVDELIAELTKKDGGSKGGGKSEAEQLAETIANFEKQLQLESELLGKSEARKRVLQALGVEFVNNNQAAVANYEAQIEAITEATRLEEQRKQIMQTVESSLESGFMTMVDGTKSVKDAFKDMARQIIAELYRVLVVQRMVGAISGAIGGIGGGSSLAPTTSLRPPVRPFANGGVVNGPTMFPMSGGQTGLMGEAGPEAIMPLKRDKNGRLGVSVDGGSGSVNVVNNINVTGGSDPAAIRMEVAKLMPQITNATKAAVIDARRRGGQMKASFG